MFNQILNPSHMKYNIILILLCLLIQDWSFAQDPTVKTRISNRNVHEQDGHFLITSLDVPVYVYAQSGESFATSEYFPFFLLQEDTTGISEYKKLEGISISPNPTPGILTVQRSTWEDAYTIDLIQSTGQVLKQWTWQPGTATIQLELETLPAGNYFISVWDQAQTARSAYQIQKR